MWMAPALQAAIQCSTAGRVKFCVRPVDAAVALTAGPDGIRELGATLLAGYDASDIRRVEPAPGLTGAPSHLFVLATSLSWSPL